MMISTKGRYALRMLVDIALHQKEGYLPLRDVAQRQDISEKYLESITKCLVRDGILQAVRGKGGGYRLALDAEQCGVRQVIEAVEGPLVPVSCMAPTAKPCPRMGDCSTHSLWGGLYETICQYLDRFSLADLATNVSGGNDFVI